MALDNTQRAELRKAMVDAFEEDTLDVFLDDEMDIRLNTIVPPDKTFDRACHLVITWADRQGQLARLLVALRDKQDNPLLKALAGNLLGPLSAAVPALPGGAAAAHPHLLGRRPLVNRSSLWTHLDEVVRGVRTDHVLLINGGVGKTYSQWLIGHACDPARNGGKLAYVDASASSAADVDAWQLAKLIANRLWGEGSLGAEGEKGAHRLAHDVAVLMINRLSALKKPVWLIVDEFDLVNLDRSALELLDRLCDAVQRGECDQLWLFLVGLDKQQLGSRVSPYVAVDLVERPRRADIESHVQALAARAGKPLSAGQLKLVVDELDALLPEAPDHAAWEAFHNLLVLKSSDIVNGTLP